MIAAIDIGSNSVRCSLHEGRETIVKKLITTRLGEGMTDGLLSREAVRRTVDAVAEFKEFARNMGAERLYAFATEAVRRAKNGGSFLYYLKKQTGIDVCLVSGEEEAELAVTGALGGDDGAVIDLGGASTELAVVRGGKLIYSHSLNVGAVVLKDTCGRDKSKLVPFIAQKTAEYGEVPPSEKVFAVGGTATSIAACMLGLKEYDPKAVHGSAHSVTELESFAASIEGLQPNDIFSRYPIDIRRSEIIYGGALLLLAALERAGADKFIASESDNLEGFTALAESGRIAATPYLFESHES